MSEQDKIKRLAYKRNRKRWLSAQVVIAILLALVIAGSIFAYFQLNKTYYLEYTETGDVNYKVYIQDGEFKDKYYPDEYLSDKAYVASLISKIVADFSYKMNIEADSVDYTYKIDAILSVVHENSQMNVFEQIVSLLPEKTVSNGSTFEIKESVDINFKEYNDKINEFFEDLKLNENDFESNLTVKLSISAVATSDALVSTAANSYDIALSIPLADLITIPEVSTTPVKENKLAEAAALNDKLLPLASACFIEVNPIPVKEAMNLLGFNAGVPRAPLTVIEDDNRKKLQAAMQNFGLEIKA